MTYSARKAPPTAPRRRSSPDRTTVFGVIRALIIGAAIAVVIDLVGAWLWLSFYDGPKFPY